MKMFFFFGIIVQGKWIGSSTWNTIVDPLNGEPFIKIAEVDETGTQVCVCVCVCVCHKHPFNMFGLHFY
jgi:1-pyrroline-5-carboxylate dehydrogenase